MESEMKRKVDIQGEIIGVDFSFRGEEDNHVLMNVYIEDDEMWFKKMSLSSAWIDDFIGILVETKKKLLTDFDKDKDGYGYQYKECEL